jgi:hypothetical protein
MSLFTEIKRVQTKLDRFIGFNFWKRYVASAFWSNLSTPVNLCITILTALMTAKSSDNSFISDSAHMNISYAALFITTLNTFFRFHVHSTENVQAMNKWSEFGHDLEEIVYSRDDPEVQYKASKELLTKVYKFKNEETSQNINFVTDIIHMCVKCTCLKKDNWMADDVETLKKNEESIELQPRIHE